MDQFILDLNVVVSFWRNLHQTIFSLANRKEYADSLPSEFIIDEIRNKFNQSSFMDMKTKIKQTIILLVFQLILSI